MLSKALFSLILVPLVFGAWPRISNTAGVEFGSKKSICSKNVMNQLEKSFMNKRVCKELFILGKDGKLFTMKQVCKCAKVLRRINHVKRIPNCKVPRKFVLSVESMTPSKIIKNELNVFKTKTLRQVFRMCFIAKKKQAMTTFDTIGGFEFEEADHTCGNDKQVCGPGRCCSIWKWCGGGAQYCNNRFDYRNDARADHRCPSGKDSECGGTRCCSMFKWCGGRRDGGAPYDDWCENKLLNTANHIWGFAHESGDVSVTFTSAFVGVLGLTGYGLARLFHKYNNKQQSSSLTPDEL